MKRRLRLLFAPRLLDSPPMGQAAATSPLPTPPSVHLALSLSGEPDLNHDHNDVPLRFRRVDNILGPTAMPSLAQRVLQQELHVVSAEEPSSFVEAASNPSWWVAMVEELKITRHVMSSICCMGIEPSVSSGSLKQRRMDTVVLSSRKHALSLRGMSRSQGLITRRPLHWWRGWSLSGSF
jgi:hypothetical protein